MLLAHFGIAVFIVGVTTVSGFQRENDVRMEIGDTTSVAGYDVRMESIEQIRGPNYNASRATLTVTSGGQPVATIAPERRVYTASGQSMTEVAIDRSLLRDVYVALGDPVDGKSWSVRVYHKPLVNWIWLGCLLMAFGGVLAVTDRRYRGKVRVDSPAATPSAAPAGGGIGGRPVAARVAGTTRSAAS